MKIPLKGMAAVFALPFLLFLTAMTDQEIAKEFWRYDPMTGVLYWADHIPEHWFPSSGQHKRFNTQFAGTVAGTVDSGGYLQVRLKNTAYLVHRIIWLIHYGEWPTFHIDHKDHNRQNNRILNLKNVSQAKNNAHKLNNTSGHPNIEFIKRSVNRPWFVKVTSKGASLTMQSFASLQEAIDHRDRVRRENNLPAVQGR